MVIVRFCVRVMVIVRFCVRVMATFCVRVMIIYVYTYLLLFPVLFVGFTEVEVLQEVYDSLFY